MKQKFIKRANMWLVAIPKVKDKKLTQNFHWFSTESEALKFIEERNERN